MHLLLPAQCRLLGERDIAQVAATHVRQPQKKPNSNFVRLQMEGPFGVWREAPGEGLGMYSLEVVRGVDAVEARLTAAALLETSTEP
jgi:hypothetical protein